MIYSFHSYNTSIIIQKEEQLIRV